MALSEKHQRFVTEYLVDLNATQAYIRAGYSPNGAGESAHTLLKNPEIQDAISEARKKLSEQTEITPAKVLNEWASIAFANPNDLIEQRMANCRHCHGAGFRHQYTDHEFAKRRTAHDKHKPTGTSARARAQAEVWDAEGVFDEGGGPGFDRYRKPNPECPECRGVGELVVVPRDSRDIPERSRRLYNGVKVTKDGHTVMMQDRGKALENIAKHLGMFVDRQAIVNPDGSAAEFAPIMFVPVQPKPRDPEEG